MRKKTCEQFHGFEEKMLKEKPLESDKVLEGGATGKYRII